jgi:hypothetical protein
LLATSPRPLNSPPPAPAAVSSPSSLYLLRRRDAVQHAHRDDAVAQEVARALEDHLRDLARGREELGQLALRGGLEDPNRQVHGDGFAPHATQQVGVRVAVLSLDSLHQTLIAQEFPVGEARRESQREGESRATRRRKR